MDKNTLSNYGWIVIAVLVLSVMIALATPFGTYIRAGVENTTAGLFDTSEKAMNVVGMSAGNGSFDYGTGSSTPDHNGPTIPVGACYGNFDEDSGIATFYTEMPATVNKLDFYVYGDYLYITENGKKWTVSLISSDYVDLLGITDYSIVDKNQTSYDAILESVNGMPVTSMAGTFSGCTNLLTAPTIPNSITDMQYAFRDCTSLVTAPVIPSSVTDMPLTFQGCTSLKNITLPDNLRSIDSHCFENCTSLTNIVIPNGVQRISWYAFNGCTSLTSIEFEGTTAQWNAITFDEGWNDGVPATVVHCSDGDATL